MTIHEMSDELLNRPSTCQRIENVNFNNGLCRDCNKKQSTIIRIMKEFDSTSDLHSSQFKKFRNDLDATYSLCPACDRHVNAVLEGKATQYPPSERSAKFPAKRKSKSRKLGFSFLWIVSWMLLVVSVAVISAIDWQRIESRAPIPVIGIPSTAMRLLNNLGQFRTYLCVSAIFALLVLHGVCSGSSRSAFMTSLPWILLVVLDFQSQHIPHSLRLALPIFSTITSLLSIASCISGQQETCTSDDKTISSKKDRKKKESPKASIPRVKEVEAGIDSLSLNGSFESTSTSSGSPTFLSDTSSLNSSIIKPAKLNLDRDYSNRMALGPKIAKMNHELWLGNGFKVQQVSFQGVVEGSPWMYLHREQLLGQNIWRDSIKHMSNSTPIMRLHQPNGRQSRTQREPVIIDNRKDDKSSNRTLTFIYTLVTLFLLISFVMFCHRVSSPSLTTPSPSSFPKIKIVWEDTFVPQSDTAMPSSLSGDDHVPLTRYLVCGVSFTSRHTYYLQLMTLQ